MSERGSAATMNERATMSERGSAATMSERGSGAVELAVLVPAVVLILGLLIGGGRLWFARTAVTEAAQTAARAASLARTAGQGSEQGRAAGEASLRTAGLDCQAHAVSVDVSGFAVPVGQPTSITSRITCSVRLADLLLPGLPGSIAVQAVGTSALDTYRGRS